MIIKRRSVALMAAEGEETSPVPLDRQDLVRVSRFVQKLAEAGYFGKITLSFQSGKITDIRTEQTMKIEDIG